jgi:hypothetical protein
MTNAELDIWVDANRAELERAHADSIAQREQEARVLARKAARVRFAMLLGGAAALLVAGGAPFSAN